MPSSTRPGPLAGRTTDRESVGVLLLHTLPGRALLLGAVIRVVAWALQRLVGPAPLLDAVGTVGTLALLAGIGYFAWRAIVLAKRHLLWRVRRKLILSYIFVGLVPALLIIVFFALCGWFLFNTISSYVIHTRLQELTEHAEFLARTSAVEVAGAPNADAARQVVERKRERLDERLPGVSLALVPAGRRCPATPAPPAASPAGASRSAFTVGPWAHIAPPAAVPDWVGCEGFTGLLGVSARERAAADASQPRLYVRAAAFPEEPAPRFAVIADIPIAADMVARLQRETGITIGNVSLSLRENGERAEITMPGRTAEAGGDRPFPNWVVFLDYTDWASGRTGRATVSIGMRIGEIYARLSLGGQTGDREFGDLLLVVIAVVGFLFLLIQFVALVMGLALARSITGSVHELFEGTERVRQGDFSHRIRVFARDQLGELADSFNGMTGRLAQLLAEMTEKKRLEEELRIARDMQMSLLPQQPPMTLPGVSITAVCSPAREVGGDYYDFFPLGDRCLGLLIADVSGKGTSAAFYMAELKGLMLSLSQMHRSPRDLLVNANRIIANHLDNRSFITVTYAVIDLNACTLTWARAGHTPLIHLRREPDGTRRARVLVSDGLVLGLKIDNGERFEALLQEASMPLARGDLFVLFTDGLSEQMNAGEELFGEERLGALVEEHGDLPFDQLRERILREVHAFAGGTAQHDDLTFILLRVDELPADAPGRSAAGEPQTVVGARPAAVQSS